MKILLIALALASTTAAHAADSGCQYAIDQALEADSQESLNANLAAMSQACGEEFAGARHSDFAKGTANFGVNRCKVNNPVNAVGQDGKPIPNQRLGLCDLYTYQLAIFTE